MTNEIAEIAAALLKHLAAPESAKEAHFWAWEYVQEAIDRGDAERAWEIILKAIELAKTNQELALIGAGVLESLLYSHGMSVVGSVEEEAKKSAKVVTALSAAYLNDADDAVQRRVHELTQRLS